MTKKMFGLGVTWLLATCALAQVASSKLPDPKLFDGCKILLKQEKKGFGQLLARRQLDGATFMFNYFIEPSAKAAFDHLRNGPHDSQLPPTAGAYAHKTLGDLSWKSSWPNGKPTGAAKLIVVSGDTVFQAEFMAKPDKVDRKWVEPPISKEDLAVLDTLVISAMHEKG